MARSFVGRAGSPPQQKQHQPLQLQPVSFGCRRHRGLLVARVILGSVVAAIYYSYDVTPRVRTYMPRSSAVLSEEATSIWCCSAHCCCCCELRAAGGALLVPPARSKSKATRTDVPLMTPPAPFLLAILAWENILQSTSNSSYLSALNSYPKTGLHR